MKSHWSRQGHTSHLIPALVGLALLALTGCTFGPTRLTATPASETTCGADTAGLAVAARQEGSVTVIGMDPDWASTGIILKKFTSSTGIAVNSIYPSASSAESLTVLRTWKRNPQRPDIAEVSMSAADTARSQAILAAYPGATWKELPEHFKDATGEWSASYLGVIAFGVNSAALSTSPTSWQDLQQPEYREAVTLNGDPRESGTAVASVMAASLANGGSLDDVGPGIDFFALLKRKGNLNPLPMTHLNVAYGDVPVALTWNFAIAGLSASDTKASTELTPQVPTDGIVGVPYAQVISRRAPHPCAAHMLIDFLNGEEAATQRMLTGAIPVAHWDEAAAFPATSSVVKALEAGGVSTHVPTAAQLTAAQEVVDQRWLTDVARAGEVSVNAS